MNPNESPEGSAAAPGPGVELSSEFSKVVGDYAIGRRLGAGCSSSVHFALNVKTGEKVAIKVMQVSALKTPVDFRRLHNEIAIMRSVKHPNVVNLRSVMRTSSNIYLVLDYVDGGDLGGVRGSKLPEETARTYFRQLVYALARAHRFGVVHRDLKLENILVCREGAIKLSDFGLSRIVPPNEEAELRTRCGTPCYVAPEILSHSSYNGYRADVWSLGVVLFVMLSGVLPFFTHDLAALFKRIRNATFEWHPAISDAVRDLIGRILVPQPKSRATLFDIVTHPWFVTGADPADLISVHEDIAIRAEAAKAAAAAQQQAISLLPPGADVDAQKNDNDRHSGGPGGPGGAGTGASNNIDEDNRGDGHGGFGGPNGPHDPRGAPPTHMHDDDHPSTSPNPNTDARSPSSSCTRSDGHSQDNESSCSSTSRERAPSRSRPRLRADSVHNVTACIRACSGVCAPAPLHIPPPILSPRARAAVAAAVASLDAAMSTRHSGAPGAARMRTPARAASNATTAALGALSSGYAPLYPVSPSSCGEAWAEAGEQLPPQLLRMRDVLYHPSLRSSGGVYPYPPSH